MYIYVYVHVYVYDDTYMFLGRWLNRRMGDGDKDSETECCPTGNVPQRKCAKEHDWKTGNLITHAPTFPDLSP